MNAKLRIDGALNRFASLHDKDIELGLGRLLKLLAKLGNPHLNLPPVVHVAGTNGKGSTISMLGAMAKAQGLRAHVHTSPHLIELNERFVIAGKKISEIELADLLEQVETVNAGAPATVFELLSAAMFLIFSMVPADLAIIEVGLGGELDATNVIKSPALSLITAISLEHTEWLGCNIADIAAAKAGIIKKNCPVISAEQDETARQVILDVAYKKQAPLQLLSEEIQCREEDGRLVWHDDRQLLDLPLPKLTGKWQVQNAALAIAAACHLGWSRQAIASGLKQAKWPGRLQRITPKHPFQPTMEVWLDGAHNPAAAQALAKFIADRDKNCPLPLHIILCQQTSKDISGFLKAFLPLGPSLHVVTSSSAPAPASPEILATECRKLGLTAHAHNNWREVLEELPRQPLRLLITGSLFLVGDVLAAENNA